MEIPKTEITSYTVIDYSLVPIISTFHTKSQYSNTLLSYQCIRTCTLYYVEYMDNITILVWHLWVIHYKQFLMWVHVHA